MHSSILTFFFLSFFSETFAVTQVVHKFCFYSERIFSCQTVYIIYIMILYYNNSNDNIIMYTIYVHFPGLSITFSLNIDKIFRSIS